MWAHIFDMYIRAISLNYSPPFELFPPLFRALSDPDKWLVQVIFWIIPPLVSGTFETRGGTIQRNSPDSHYREKVKNNIILRSIKTVIFPLNFGLKSKISKQNQKIHFCSIFMIYIKFSKSCCFLKNLQIFSKQKFSRIPQRNYSDQKLPEFRRNPRRSFSTNLVNFAGPDLVQNLFWKRMVFEKILKILKWELLKPVVCGPGDLKSNKKNDAG